MQENATTNGRGAGRPRVKPPRSRAADAAPADAAPAATAISPKHAKFRELGAPRVDRALAAIAVIGNLANRNNYDFTDAEVAKITQTLHAAVDDLAERFKPKPRRSRGFSF